jgi:hypothetical protein
MLKVPLLSDDVDAEMLLSNIALGLGARNAQKD